MASGVLLAVDLGASSGRLLAGLWDARRLTLQEVHRFDNGPVPVAGSLHWDLLRLWSEVQAGMRAAAARYGAQAIRSLGVDTWGVDFGLLGRHDTLLGNPYHYRDRRTQGLMERAFDVVPRREIFEHTGLQFMPFNTLYQLWAMRLGDSPLLASAQRLLMIPDLFHWLLTGAKAIERTNATTTQFFDPRSGNWATALLERFDLPGHILGDVVEPGTHLGALRREVADETGLHGTHVVAPGTHDTASAVMAVPARGRNGGGVDWCYISSGTWSLLGAEVPQPVINDTCLRLNFTNEGGIGGTTRLLKNIAGLWLLQECRRTWTAAARPYSWDELNRLADAARPRLSLVDPDDPRFAAPTDMPRAIAEYCRETGQTVPDSEGATVRCALESLALKYRQVLGWLEQLLGSRVETIHIVGGGVHNKRLNQATADACGRRVLAGPVEATAVGNLMVQAMAAGWVASVDEAREVIRLSFPVEEYLPRDTAAWDEAFERFVRLSPEPR
jgi:rhamnulokinase